jgi:hypothetical protein
MLQMSKADQTHAQFWSRGSSNSAVSAVAKKSKEQVMQLYGNVLADNFTRRVSDWLVAGNCHFLQAMRESDSPLEPGLISRSKALAVHVVVGKRTHVNAGKATWRRVPKGSRTMRAQEPST